MTTAHFMDDSILLEIYIWEIYRICRFQGTRLHENINIFRTDAFMTLKLHRKRQIGYTKNWKSFIDLATSVFGWVGLR